MFAQQTPKEDYIPLHALLEKRSSSDVQSTPLWHEPLSSSPTSSQHNVTSHTACSAPEFLGTNGTANDIQQCQPPVNARTQPAVSLPQHQWPQTTGSVTVSQKRLLAFLNSSSHYSTSVGLHRNHSHCEVQETLCLWLRKSLQWCGREPFLSAPPILQPTKHNET